MSHSQNKEEEIILAMCHRIEKGYVLDVGAGDGDLFSNSRALIDSGWTGCMIEADYEPFAKLAALYGANPAIRLVNAAVDTEGGLAEFSKSSDGGLYSTLKPDGRFDDKMLHKYWVPKITPSQVVDLCERGPDFITVDIEGRSFEVLRGLPFASWNVRGFCVEHDHRTEEIAAWANEKGYRVAELNGENLIGARR
jgi:FkbM family methyltransferase